VQYVWDVHAACEVHSLPDVLLAAENISASADAGSTCPPSMTLRVIPELLNQAMCCCSETS